MEIQRGTDYRPGITELLVASKLPADDLPASLDQFVVVLHEESVIGVAGIEPYQKYGLLRSVAVQPSYQNKGIAAALLKHAESLAAANGIRTLFLLTETAERYFARKGYETVNRDEVPEMLKQSSEFSHVCPKSALVMQKQLTGANP